MDKQKIAATVIVSVLFLQVVIGGAPAAGEIERKGGVASCHLRELELCMLGTISMFQNPNGIPIASAEFNRQCEYLQESCECFQDYRDNCMTKLQAGLLEPFVRDLGEFEDEFCTNGTKTNSIYMKHAACLRGVQKKFQRSCVADMQVGFESIHKIAHNMRLPTACCNMNKLCDCIMPHIEEKCGQEAVDFVEGLIKRAIGRTFDVSCREYEPNSAKCNGLLPGLHQKPFNGRNTSAISRVISSYANSRSM